MKMGSASEKERNPRLSHTWVYEVPHEESMGWKLDQKDPPAALMGPKSKPPRDLGTPPCAYLNHRRRGKD